MKIEFYGEEHETYANTHKFYAVIFSEAENLYKGIYGRLPGYGNRQKTVKQIVLTGQWDAQRKIGAKSKNYKSTKAPDWLIKILDTSANSTDMWSKLEKMFEECNL